MKGGLLSLSLLSVDVSLSAIGTARLVDPITNRLFTQSGPVRRAVLHPLLPAIQNQATSSGISEPDCVVKCTESRRLSCSKVGAEEADELGSAADEWNYTPWV